MPSHVDFRGDHPVVVMEGLYGVVGRPRGTKWGGWDVVVLGHGGPLLLPEDEAVFAAEQERKKDHAMEYRTVKAAVRLDLGGQC